MKKKRRSIAIAAVLMLTAALSGCGDEPAEEAGVSVTENDVEITNAAEEVSDGAPDESQAAGSDSGSIDIKAVLDSVMSETGMTSMTEVGEDRIGNYLEADTSQFESFSMWICGSGAFADETALFVLNNEDYAADLEDALNKRLETKTNDYKDYKPEECPKMDSAVIKTNGKYVFFAVSSDNGRAEEIFDENF